jgi:hypothetical protein
MHAKLTLEIEGEGRWQFFIAVMAEQLSHPAKERYPLDNKAEKTRVATPPVFFCGFA